MKRGTPFLKYGPKYSESTQKRETTEEFLARGGKIQRFSENLFGSKRGSNKIDAQKLLDAAVGTGKEKEVIAFLKAQGIEVK